MLACAPFSCGVVAINALFGHALVHLQMLFKLTHAPNKLNSTVLDAYIFTLPREKKEENGTQTKAGDVLNKRQ
jgi:hypothetical protein